MDLQTVKHIVREELPGLIRSDKRIRKFVIDLTREVTLEKADKKETESRFDRMLEELKRDREEQSRKWDEQQREQNKKWEEQNKKWKEQQQEYNKKWEEQNKKWKEQQQEYNKKWEEQNKRLDRMEAKTDKLLEKVLKQDSTLGALGARWGYRAESSFRNGLKWLLEEHYNVKVINFDEYDEEGEVYGRPDQVELDILIVNTKLIICEIKSSLSKSDIYYFQKKAKFYEKRHNRQPDYVFVISPMVDEKAQAVARELGIKVFSYTDDIPPDILS